jgi:hypothetical protein
MGRLFQFLFNFADNFKRSVVNLLHFAGFIARRKSGKFAVLQHAREFADAV